MKIQKMHCKVLVVLSFICLMSCAPTIHYLGDTYSIKNDVDVFYDEKDVENQYKTIGRD